MKLLPILVLLIFGCAGTRVNAVAPEKQYTKEDAHRISAALVARVTKLFRDRLLPTLPASEAKIVRQIVFDDPSASSVDGWEIPSAYIDKKNNSRHVRVSAGFGALAMELSVAATLQQADPSCVYTDYVQYVGKSIHRSRDLIREKRPPERVSTALDFFNIPKAQWDDLMKQKQGYFKNTLMGFRYMIQDFVVAHEIGHHVLGHVFHSPKNLEVSRNQEKAADEWAIEALVRTGELPLGGVAFGLLMVSSRGSDIVFEHLETHPAEFRRLDYIFEALVKNIRRVPDTALPPGLNIDAFETEMRSIQKQLHAEFEKSVHEEITEDEDESDDDRATEDEQFR